MSTFRAVGQSRLSVRCRRGKLRPKWRAVNVRRTFACLRKRVRRMRIAVIPHEWLAHRSAALFGLPRRVPIVWTYNDPSHWHVHSGWGLRDLPYRALGWLDTRQINRFAAVTVLSRWMAELAERTFTAPVHLVRCGIDAQNLPAAPARHGTPGTGPAVLRLGSVGVLAPWRRLEDAIRAVAAARDAGAACHYGIIGSDRFWPAYG